MSNTNKLTAVGTSSQAGDRITVKINLDRKDYDMLMKAFKVMDKEAQDRLRARNKLIVSALAHKIQQAAAYAPNPRQAQQVAKSVRGNRDRIPNITIGGARKASVSRKGNVNNPKPTYGELLFGTEFGQSANSPRRFKQGGMKFPYLSAPLGRGRRGYFIFPTLRRNQEMIRRDYLETVYKLLKQKWGPNG